MSKRTSLFEEYEPPKPSLKKPAFGFSLNTAPKQPVSIKKFKLGDDNDSDNSSNSNNINNNNNNNNNNNSNKNMNFKPFGHKEEEERSLKPLQNNNEDDEDEVDPLDAFMEGVNAQAKIESKQSIEKQTTIHQQQPNTTTKDNNSSNQQNQKSLRDDIEDEDEEELYYRLRNKQKNDQDKNDDSINNIDDDEDDLDDEESLKNNQKKKRIIEPLPPIDHSKISYVEFEKYFYQEHDDIANLSSEEVFEFRKQLDIRITGNDLVNPVASFGHFGFHDTLIQAIQKQNYEQPTAIQKQAIPIALSGRDMIAIAKTGSGKTATFIWPSIPHIMDQPYLEKDDGPIALFLAPTRELAHQIYLETVKFARYYKLRTSVLYGGVSKLTQCKELKAGCEIIVSTPGRLIDMIKLKATKLNRVSYLVLDEADKMFDFGFGPQVLSIVGQIRPDRQTLLFSATFKPSVEDFARNILDDPIKISIGSAGSANQDITQIAVVLNSESDKWSWLTEKLPSLLSQGNVLIFVSTKNAVEELSANLIKFGFTSNGLHGDKDQQERSAIVATFKDGKIPILVATDIAARGLDINLIKNVVNFDPSRDIESHTHRIGRTGRAGNKGVAYTLVTPKDINFSVDLIKNLENANQFVPPELINIAMNNSYFRRERSGKGNNNNNSRNGRGRGRGGRNSRGGGFSNRGRGLGYNNNNNNNNSNNNNNNNNYNNRNNRNDSIDFIPARGSSPLDGGNL